MMGKSGGLHWVTDGAPVAADAGVAARPPSASNEMDPTAANTTVRNALNQRPWTCAAAGVSRDAPPPTGMGSLIRTQATWTNAALRPWPDLRTIPPLHGPPEAGPCNGKEYALTYLRAIYVSIISSPIVTTWNFLTSHGRALLCIAHNPDVRIRDIATTLAITERRAHGIVTDLTDAGYLIKTKEGRRNRYEIQSHLPIPEAAARERAIGEVLDLLGGRPEPEERIGA